MFSTAISSETLEIKAGVIIEGMLSLVSFSVHVPKCIAWFSPG